jgi:hypothetical protein
MASLNGKRSRHLQEPLLRNLAARRRLKHGAGPSLVRNNARRTPNDSNSRNKRFVKFYKSTRKGHWVILCGTITRDKCKWVIGHSGSRYVFPKNWQNCGQDGEDIPLC